MAVTDEYTIPAIARRRRGLVPWGLVQAAAVVLAVVTAAGSIWSVTRDEAAPARGPAGPGWVLGRGAGVSATARDTPSGFVLRCPDGYRLVQVRCVKPVPPVVRAQP